MDVPILREPRLNIFPTPFRVDRQFFQSNAPATIKEDHVARLSVITLDPLTEIAFQLN